VQSKKTNLREEK